MINAYIKTLYQVIGSEEEAKKNIYSVCTTTYTGFGALISEELSYKVKGLPGILWVLLDSYLDIPNRDYGGDLFVDGKVIHRPQYRYNERQQTRNRPHPQYKRRRETMQTERREPLRRETWAQIQKGPMQQPVSHINEWPEYVSKWWRTLYESGRFFLQSIVWLLWRPMIWRRMLCSSFFNDSICLRSVSAR